MDTQTDTERDLYHDLIHGKYVNLYSQYCELTSSKALPLNDMSFVVYCIIDLDTKFKAILQRKSIIIEKLNSIINNSLSLSDILSSPIALDDTDPITGDKLEDPSDLPF